MLTDSIRRRFPAISRLLLPGALACVVVLCAAAAAAETPSLDDDGALVIQGRRVFPVGIFSVAEGEIPTVPDAAFDLICSPYFAQGTTSAPEYLEAAQQAGFMFIPGFAADVIRQRNDDYIRNYVEAVAGHPSLLAWYLFEEPDTTRISPEDGRHAYDLVKQLDPKRPVLFIHYKHPELLDYRSCFDVFGYDSYPIGNSRLATWRLRLREVVAGVAPKPAWVIAQAFGAKDWVEPTDLEQRSMAYLSAINGAKGIIFYMHGRKGDSYYIREHDDHWRYLAGLGAELREMSPILIAPAPPQKARADQPGLDVVLKQHEDKLFLLAANHDSEGPAEDGHFPGRMLAGVRLEADGLPDGRAESIGSAGTGSAAGGRVLKMAAGRIVDTFDAYAVHLYRLIPDTYGCPWNADGLANLEIGKQQGRRISFRFRAEHSGELESAALYLVFRALGYYHGDGGQVLLELQTDDGTPEHRPSGTVVASSLVQDPMAKWNRTFTFDKPPRLIKGELYHIVLSNPAPDPVQNYVSVDCLHNSRRTPHVQPGVADTDLAVLWKQSGEAEWSASRGHTPIFVLKYATGAVQGQGYTDALAQSGVCRITGDAKVRETIDVSGSSRRVGSLWVRLRRQGLPGPLTLALQQADGSLIESTSIPAGAISEDYSWIGCKLRSNPALKSGGGYVVELSASGPEADPAGGAYETFPLQEGGQYGFGCPGVFTDGSFQFTTDGLEWQYPRGAGRTDFDLQFYFVLAPPAAEVAKFDLSGDGVVDTNDMAAIRDNLNKNAAEGDNRKYDLNGDGRINVLDMILLRNELAKQKK